jgi:hypothetical protein
MTFRKMPSESKLNAPRFLGGFVLVSYSLPSAERVSSLFSPQLFGRLVI